MVHEITIKERECTKTKKKKSYNQDEYIVSNKYNTKLPNGDNIQDPNVPATTTKTTITTTTTTPQNHADPLNQINNIDSSKSKTQEHTSVNDNISTNSNNEQTQGDESNNLSTKDHITITTNNTPKSTTDTKEVSKDATPTMPKDIKSPNIKHSNNTR